jgi:hypothetical protein
LFETLPNQNKIINFKHFMAGRPCLWHRNCRSFEPFEKKTPNRNFYLDFSNRPAGTLIAQKHFNRYSKGGNTMDVQSRISKAQPLVVPGAQNALSKMKYETASELAINVPNGDYWGDVSSRDCGRVGGNMVRKLIAIAEQQLK